MTVYVHRIEYYDEVSKVEVSVDAEEEKEVPPTQADFAVKVLKLSNLSLELGTSVPPAPGSPSAPVEGRDRQSVTLQSLCCV